MNIAVISGSARPKRQSHQVALTVKARLDNMGYSNWMWDVRETSLPLLDWTFESHPQPGEVLKELKTKLDSTDAFIIVSPEHNASYPGSLKNSMDYFFGEYAAKPFGLVGVSAGALGGVLAIKNLQNYVLKLNGIVCPQFLITPKVQSLYNGGELTDEGYSQRIDKFIADFLELAVKFK